MRCKHASDSLARRARSDSRFGEGLRRRKWGGGRPQVEGEVEDEEGEDGDQGEDGGEVLVGEAVELKVGDVEPHLKAGDGGEEPVLEPEGEYGCEGPLMSRTVTRMAPGGKRRILLVKSGGGESSVVWERAEGRRGGRGGRG